MFNLFDVREKIEKIIKRVETLENRVTYMQKIKTIANDVHYVIIPKREILIPAGLKKGDWVKIILIPTEMKEVNKNE